MTHSLNGRTGELLRYVIALAVAALVSYFTAMNAIQERVAIVDTREQTRFEEFQRSLARIERAIERIEATGVDRRTGEPLSLQRQFDR